MKRSYVALALAVVISACAEGPTESARPLFDQSGPQANPRYIVRFRNNMVNASGESDRLASRHRGRLAFKYTAAIQGFAGEFSAADIAALARDPNVIAIERDQIAYATGTQTNPPSWGLDRIDQRNLPLGNSYTWGPNGSGVRVYILDTGILFSHNDFGGRAVAGIDQITPGGSATDCAGHGTHVAGTVGGNTYGVAKNVMLVAVRVLDCTGTGSYSQVIAGVDWVTLQKQSNPSIPMVANMSLGGPVSSALNAAVANSIAAGVTYAVSAGNDNLNACTASPASSPNAITVGSTTINDARSSFSNFGSCLDIFAPGSAITSAWYTGNSATNTISGTSMASPHVAGAAALYLEANPAALPAAVASALITNATMNVVTSPGTGSPNRLLYTGFIVGTPPVPVANFTFNCSNLSCAFDGNSSTAQPTATYAWAWGDGTPNGSGKTATHAFAAAGTYSVTLTVSDAGGTNARTQAVTVTAPPPGNQPPVAVPVVTCVGMTCTYDARGSTDDVGIVAYEWYPGGPNIISTQPLFSMTWGAARTRTWTLTVRDGGGLSHTQSVTFTVPGPTAPPPVANYTFSCTNLTCSFDGSSSTAQPGATYGWAWGDGSPNGSGATTTHTFPSAGTFSVVLTVTDAGGSNSRTQAVTVTAPPPPVPVANYTFNCVNLSCSFDGTSSTAQPTATYAWGWGDGTPNGSGKTATHTFAAAGTFSVTLTVTDAGGANSRTQSVTVTAPPPGNQPPVAVPVVTCSGMTCTYDARGSTDDVGIVAYEWYPGGPNVISTQPLFTMTWGAAKTRTWTLVVRDGGGLSHSQTFTFTVPQP